MPSDTVLPPGGASIHWSDLEQEPYDPEEFVERLAWRSSAQAGNATTQQAQNPFDETPSTNPFDDVTTTSKAGLLNGGVSSNQSKQESGDVFDAHLLNEAFVQAIKDLTGMQEKQRKKCQMLEQVYYIGLCI